ncbi:hypothetical protein CC1G_15659 [Coprinopsis cinerea okayama7|uniref:Uncharacterized protein n=1 Tax=Coprinopsis cinerea (strain Okayama-7 / 130 / ATCC MYA-4618 / FGSC 9003) TaxID=240176 RepID=D6RQB9_COPC7|nr:hypothetical protein CC1G_15659 [Coprinopsis cinerea okayama7\|eukprot:XP_002910229.1 hypothetical protein CC1G_15659 [Coprinopsis cinerea okayama7\
MQFRVRFAILFAAITMAVALPAEDTDALVARQRKCWRRSAAGDGDVEIACEK